MDPLIPKHPPLQGPEQEPNRNPCPEQPATPTEGHSNGMSAGSW